MREAIELTKEFLQDYLADFWKTGPVEVTSIVKFPRGMSRETWFVECVIAGSELPTKLICRRDLPSVGVVPTSLRYEYEIYDRLQGTKVPIARTIVYEDDPKKLPDDRHFYLREQIDGDWDDPNYLNPDPRFDEMRVAMAREHVSKLAQIHTCDWKALGFDKIMRAPKTLDDCARTSIDRYLDILAEYQIEPMPILTEAKEWLLDNAPTAPRISLIKGTNGRGEEVFRDGKIVAMSDWEQAALGDPASDFARTQDFLNDIVHDGKKIWGLEPTLAYYEELTGIRISPQSVQYYHVLNCFENVVSLHHAAGPLTDGSDRLVRLAWLSTEALYYANLMLLGAVMKKKVDPALVFSTQTTAVKD